MVPVNTLPPRSDMETVSGVADAAARNDTDALQRLVEAGTPVNIRDSSTGLFPLAIACSSGHVEAAKVLLQSGAKIGNGDEVSSCATFYHVFYSLAGFACDRRHCFTSNAIPVRALNRSCCRKTYPKLLYTQLHVRAGLQCAHCCL